MEVVVVLPKVVAVVLLNLVDLAGRHITELEMSVLVPIVPMVVKVEMVYKLM
jgi:hypothetical protein